MLCGFFCALFRHVQKFGLFYGFISGSLATLCVLAALVWYVVLEYPAPWKIIDPADPRFDPMKFEFTDYGPNTELQKTLNTLFPPGTEKTYVDKILGNIGGARIEKVTGKNPYKDNPSDQEYYCEYRTIRSMVGDYLSHMPEGEFAWKVLLTYDEDNKLKKIRVI